MKRIYTLQLILCFLCTGCVEPEINESLIRVEGLLGFSLSTPEKENVEYSISNLPIEEEKTLIIKVESEEKNPVDVTRLIARANLGMNATMSPSLAGITDLSKPLDIYVTDRNKITRHYKIQVELVPPKLRFKKMWEKSISELGITNTNDWVGIAAKDDKLVMAEYFNLKVLDKLTGEFLNQYGNPLAFTRQINSDDAGHLVVSDYTLYNNFENGIIDIDNIIENKPAYTSLGSYTQAEVGGILMQKVTVTGDVTRGTAYIYGTRDSDNGYYVMELKDGVKVPGTPTKQGTPFGEGNFKRATIKRKSIDPNSEIIMTAFFGPDSNTDKESRWAITKNLLQYKEIDQACFALTILDFDYFTVGDEEFVAMAIQEKGMATPVEMRLYNITKDVFLECKPTDESGIFNEFLCFKSSQLLNIGYYYERSADVETQVSGNDVYMFLYSGCASDQLTNKGGGIIAYHMIYTPKD